MSKAIRLLAAAAGAFGVVAALAIAAPTNGNFETGTFEGWKRVDQGNNDRSKAKGVWQVYKNRLRDTNAGPPIKRRGGAPFKLGAPPRGTYAAGLFSLGEGTHILHRVLEVDEQSELSMQLAFKNTADDFYVLDSLSPDGDANQQLRIDLMEPDAPIDSLEGSDIIDTLFSTQSGDPRKRAYSKLKADVEPGTVRLRIAEVDNQSNFLVGVDAVKLKAK
jgi:hypothetical protein